MKRANLIQTVVLGSMMTFGIAAQTSEPYHGQTRVPNNAAANDQPNTAVSGNTPETNSSLQENRSGNMGFNPGWLGLLGLGGLLGLRRGGTQTEHTHDHAPEMHRA
jgi:MYXO-CTERM domain-containing protein